MSQSPLDSQAVQPSQCLENQALAQQRLLQKERTLAFGKSHNKLAIDALGAFCHEAIAAECLVEVVEKPQTQT